MVASFNEKCNLDSDGKPRCENDHYLKRFVTPLENGRGEKGLRCNVCRKRMKC